MVKIDNEMKQMFENLKEPPTIATVDGDGKPNVSCKGTMAVLMNENLCYAKFMGLKPTKVETEPTCCSGYHDRDTFRGYQFKGTAEVLKEGSLYEMAVQQIKGISERTGATLPPPKAAIKISINDIYALGPLQK